MSDINAIQDDDGRWSERRLADELADWQDAEKAARRDGYEAPPKWDQLGNDAMFYSHMNVALVSFVTSLSLCVAIGYMVALVSSALQSGATVPAMHWVLSSGSLAMLGIACFFIYQHIRLALTSQESAAASRQLDLDLAEFGKLLDAEDPEKWQARREGNGGAVGAA
ncbi:MAG: hypothetical protein RIA64_10535 [Rhodospirillales bacterium]